MSKKLSNKQIVLIIFIVSLTIRLLYGIYIFKIEGTNKFVDDWVYINYAKNIMSQGIFVPDIIKLKEGISTPTGLRGGASAFIGPGFPLIVAFVFMFFGENFLPVILLNALISSLLCLLIFYIGRELFNERVAVFASVWSIFYILFIKYTPRILKENWLAFLFPLIIFLFLRETKRKEISLYFLLLISILFTCLIHMDERYFTYFPFLLIGFIFLDKDSWKKGLKKALSFSLIVFALMVPWLIRNYIVYNRIIIISVRTAPFTEKLFGYSHVEYFKSYKDAWYLSPDQINSVLLGNLVTNRSGKISEEQVDAMRDGIIPKPFSKFEIYLSRFIELWEPIDLKRSYYQCGYRYDGVWSLRHNLSVGLTYGILLPFAFIGLIIFFKQKRNIAIFLASILFLHSLINVLFIPFTINRYRIPIDTIIILLGVYGFIELFNNIKIKINKSG
jgi:4-amino-4-deoxy-L-arabinose transferase-like glycosyltransferase